MQRMMTTQTTTTDVNDKDDDLVADTAVFHEGGMLWSSATVRATRAIARYAERCLVPGVAFGEGDGVGVTRTREVGRGWGFIA